MDHFNITQVCHHCIRGSKLFRVDLSCYGSEQMNRFCFTCQFCRQVSSLDFYRFSHPDLIRYLKRLHEQYEETRKALDRLYILFNNIKK